MKESHLIFILIIFSLFSSCNKDEDENENIRIISSKISKSFIFDIKEGDPTDIYLEEIIDASLDPNIQQYIESILNYKVIKITSVRSNYAEENAPNVKLNGIFYDKDPSYIGSTFFYGFDVNLDPEEGQDPKNREIEIIYDEKGHQEIANLFKEKHKFNLKFKGNISDTPLYYIITFNFYLEATVPK